MGLMTAASRPRMSSIRGGDIPALDDYARDLRELRCQVGGRALRGDTSTHRPGLVTIVTVGLNSSASLPRTIDSIVAQTYPKIEYIVVDGGSNDGTLDLLRQRDRDIDLWLSEPDRGISDAFNKGIALAHGEFLALVNSDDWIEPLHVERAVQHLQTSEADFVFGDILIHDKAGALRYSLMGDPDYRRRIVHAMPDINHPSVVCRRELYERHGLYDLGLRVAMDYEWLLRCHIRGMRGEYSPGLTSHMSGDGVSNRNARAGLAEVRDVSARYGYSPSAAWVRYAGRMAKTGVRLFLERCFSQRFTDRMRGLTHRRLRAVGPGFPA
jgi:glycosyltransferase involved in cell wall biosynthesis